MNQSINASGQVVSNFQPIQVPVATTANGVTTTASVPFTPVAINNSGQIAGNLTPQNMPSDVGIYQNGKFFDISRALGLTGDVTTAAAINNAGSVLVSDFHPDTHLTSYFIYNADGTTQMLPKSGPLTAMNNLGQVVGSGLLFSNGSFTPLTDLLPPSSQSFWSTLVPMAINDEGQIAGFAGTSDGTEHAFLMTPTPTPTPEPTSIAMFGVAIASISLREWARRRRKR